MLTKYDRVPTKYISEADPADLFDKGLEYNPPARGPWNIVHTGMLIPQARQIYVCARGCLRGVILTAAEMSELSRMSWVSVDESDLYDGSIEQKVIDGVADILDRLDEKPPAVLLYLSCIHLFAGCDFERILSDLRNAYPDILFTDCYMTPTMRHTITPDALMRIQLYSFIDRCEIDDRKINIIGNDMKTKDSELVLILRKFGYKVGEIHDCNSFSDYLNMGSAFLNITDMPNAYKAGEKLKVRLGTKHLHLRVSYDLDIIESQLLSLSKYASDEEKTDLPDYVNIQRKAAEKAIIKTYEKIGKTPIAIDFTAVPYPFELSKLLFINGFNVKYVIADSVQPDEMEAFNYLKENNPDMILMSAVNTNMLYVPEKIDEEVLAIGQKAAHYTGTDHFVNMISSGGLRDYKGIISLMDMIEEAYKTPKDRKRILRHKGLGCSSCLV